MEFPHASQNFGLRPCRALMLNTVGYV